MIVLGLTGSIGMGKTTTAQLFAEAGLPVHSADEAVHALYAGAAAPVIEAAFPGTLEDGVVDRERLGRQVLGDPEALRRLEAIVHPLVREAEVAFLKTARKDGAPAAILDIPLLFETGGEGRCDRVVVVSAPADLQRQRVLARPGMSEAKFRAILQKQLPDAEKRARADFVVDTSRGIEAARGEVAAILRALGVAPGPAAG
ncbi:dephospho-CoA kinase [Aurantimonas sp. 22II-16-19i]|uniref:dephospho-CoA kinase n=1 Tax=Aurantimonas sp. 22II-16-19i TaxID=1317114 RepID=UPI0009F7A7E1|nr:dephospho-CoA kinase [Aurantimonas sp. 22II-16-19i]ORE92099.1 dephospho-CoA kinase [Aurantimonas sp. 22II-16-19i]